MELKDEVELLEALYEELQESLEYDDGNNNRGEESRWRSFILCHYTFG